jgi:PAS domain S-box-containing protein
MVALTVCQLDWLEVGGRERGGKVAPSPYALLLFVAAGAMALLATYGWRHRTAHPAAPIFVAMVLCVAVYLAAYGSEILGTSLASKERWETVIIIALAWVPFLWLTFALQYTGQELWLAGRNLTLLALPSIITTSLTLTNRLHRLVWTDITLDASGPFLATIPERGPWFWVHGVVGYAYLLFGIGLFIVTFSRSATLFRRQSLILITSCFIPMLGNVLHLAGVIPVPGLDPGAFSFALSAGLLSLGLFRYRMLDIVPVAQRVVLDHLHDGVIVFDPHERIVDLNPAARQMLNLGPGEMVGELAATVLQPAELLADLRTAGDGLDEIPVASGEARRWLQVSVLPLPTDRRQEGGRILIAHDVTRERAAEQLRQDLTHITIHDLRNPLNIVSASLRLMADAPPKAIDPSLHLYLQLAERGCRRAIDLVNSILQVSQLESGQVPLRRQPIPPAELIAEVAQGMRLLATEGQLTLDVVLPPSLPAIWVDAALLRRVLENLVGNAVKFTPPGGTVRISAQPRQDALQLTVADTGPGIPPEMTGRLFQKFCTGPGDKRGSGLGLVFCKLAIEAHGGRIWIDSSPGQGTTVRATVPLYCGQEADQSPPAPDV